MAKFFFILFHHSTTTAIRVHPLSMKPHSSKNDQDKRDEKETLPLQQQEVITHRMWKVFAPHTILGKRWRTTFKSLHYYVPCTVGCAPERFPRKTAPFPRKTPLQISDEMGKSEQRNDCLPPQSDTKWKSRIPYPWALSMRTVVIIATNMIFILTSGKVSHSFHPSFNPVCDIFRLLYIPR